MHRKSARDSDARNRLFFETLEPRELLAADTTADWWSSWDVAATDDYAWTFDDSWVAGTGGDAFWDGGFWDGGVWDDGSWDGEWWLDDAAGLTTDEGIFDTGSLDSTAQQNESDTASVVDDGTVSDEPATATDAGGSPTDAGGDVPLVPDPTTAVDPAWDDPPVPETVIVEDVIVEDVIVEDVIVEDVSVEDVSVEDVSVEDVSVEDVSAEDVVVDEAVRNDVDGDDTAFDLTDVDTATDDDATSRSDDVAIESWSPDQSFGTTDDLDVPDVVVDAEPDAGPIGDGDATPVDDVLPRESVTTIVPVTTVSGSSMSGAVPSGSVRGDVFRAWGAFFIPSFGQSSGGVDTLAAGSPAEAAAPTGRPRTRLPFRTFR